MELICAIDMLDGGAVRLVQGDYERRIGTDVGAPELARRFVRAGCRRLHAIDLAGARAGRPMHLRLLRDVVAAARGIAPDAVVEAGGGLRRPADVAALLAVADEALLGTAAVEDAAFLRSAAARYPGRIGVSLDLRDGRPAMDGWVRTGDADATTVARRVVDDGASRLIVTDTGRDGTLRGPNLDLLRMIRQAVPDAVLVAAGGIGCVDDLRAVRDVGCDGAVVGLALITGAIDPVDAVAALS